MIIRDIEEKDIKSCLDIYNYYIKNTTVTFEETLMSYDDFLNRVNTIKSKYPYLVLEEDSRVIGYVYLDKFSNRSAYRCTVDLSIYLDKDYTNKGYGKLLLSEIEKKARELNIKNIISIITKENTASIKFHEENGFIKVGELKDVGYKFNRFLSNTYYQKSLY